MKNHLNLEEIEKSDYGLIQEIEALKLQVKVIEQVCQKLEAERDAHMEVIKQCFNRLLENNSTCMTTQKSNASHEG